LAQAHVKKAGAGDTDLDQGMVLDERFR